MNKGVLKNFALWGRKKLKEDLYECIRLNGFKLDEKCTEINTYLWFIRFVILRFVDLKGYLPDNCRFFSLEKDKRHRSSLRNSIEYLKKIFPKIFNDKNNENTELFLEIQLREDSFVNEFITKVNNEELREVETIGWLHQFYLTEDYENIVGMNNGIIRSENVPAATQFFTPKWIVRYMVDNSLGKLWVENKESSPLKDKLKYYIEAKDKNTSYKYKHKEIFGDLIPEDIRFLDPACGCGHILVYVFEVLFYIYKSCGYEQKEIPMLIIKNNIFGLDIDQDAVAIAEAALILLAREKDVSFFNKISFEHFTSNLLCIIDSNSLANYKEILLQEVESESFARKQIENLINSFMNGEELGSLLEINNFDLNFWEERLKYINKISYKECNELLELLNHLVKQSRIISQKYHVVCTNPPYMSKKYMHRTLKTFIKEKYSLYNGDLFSVFIIRNLNYTKGFGYAAFMTPFVWMFIKEYEKLRSYIIDKKSIVSLIQLEYSAYADATVPICTFVIGNYSESAAGDYIRLSDYKGAENQPLKVIEAITNSDVNYRFCCSLKRFKLIPGCPIAYWVSKKLLDVFTKAERLEKYIDITGSQNVTADNDKYLRKHWEIDRSSINKRWQLYTKGGAYRKWYGNIEYVVDWCEDAKEFYKINNTSNLLSEEYCFRAGITYSGISLKGFAVREVGKNIYDKGGPTFHLRDESLKYYLLALLNSKVISTIMHLYNPTINYQVQDVKSIPFILAEDKDLRCKIDKLSKECIEISQRDWSFKETSLEFEKHPFIIFKLSSGSLEEIFYSWKQYCNEQYYLLKEKEEELNKIFIKLYGLEGELNSEIADEDITVAKANLKEDMISFMSYSIGCILGRYTLDNFSTVNCIPLTKEHVFEESLINKFIEFISLCFGKNKLKENLKFIAFAIGGEKSDQPLITISKYFLKYFYKNHMKIYKKRPIYWRFTSGEKMAFNALVYMHNLNHDFIRRLRINYVETMLMHMRQTQSRLKKDKLKKQQLIKEVESYVDLLQRFENTSIKLDLDEGVIKNYNKFIDLLEKI